MVYVHNERDKCSYDVNEIKSSVCEKYRYDSLAYNVEEIKEDVSDTKDVVELRRG